MNKELIRERQMLLYYTVLAFCFISILGIYISQSNTNTPSVGLVCIIIGAIGLLLIKNKKINSLYSSDLK
jgi:hypothetical protein